MKEQVPLGTILGKRFAKGYFFECLLDVETGIYGTARLLGISNRSFHFDDGKILISNILAETDAFENITLKFYEKSEQ